MRRNALGLMLALSTGALGCGNSVKSWSCAYVCTSPQAAGTATYQDDDAPEAEDKCAADHGGTKCSTGFSCTCVQAP